MCKFTSIFVVATTDTAAHRVPNDGENKKSCGKTRSTNRNRNEKKRKEKELNICVYFYNNIEQIVGAYVWNNTPNDATSRLHSKINDQNQFVWKIRFGMCLCIFTLFSCSIELRLTVWVYRLYAIRMVVCVYVWAIVCAHVCFKICQVLTHATSIPLFIIIIFMRVPLLLVAADICYSILWTL